MEMQAIELLALFLILSLFLAFLIILVNCLASCWENWRNRRRKDDVEKLPDNYVHEIHRLLDRHRRAMNEYDYPNSECGHTCDYDERAPLTESVLGTPVKMRSRSNSGKLKQLKQELEDFRVESTNELGKEECEEKRRTWGGLNDSVFDPIEMPDNEMMTSVTSSELMGISSVKIETTV